MTVPFIVKEFGDVLIEKSLTEKSLSGFRKLFKKLMRLIFSVRLLHRLVQKKPPRKAARQTMQ